MNFTFLTHSYFRILIIVFFVSFSSTAQQGDYLTHCGDYGDFSKNSYKYQIWQNWGDGCLVIKNNGDFYTSWSKIGNALARKGVKPGVPNQKITYSVQNNFKGHVFYGAYGWWRNENATGVHNKVVEFYVIESYGDWNPKDNLPKVGTVYADGSDYDIYIGNISKQPTVYQGIYNFTQVKCIRRNKRSSGAISAVKHFNKWASLGWPVGSLYEVSFKIEGYSHNGAVNRGNAYISANLSTSGTYTGGNASSGSSQTGGSNQQSGSSSQQIDNGIYELVSGTGAFLEAPYSGALLRSRTTTNGNKTKWRFNHVGNNVYEIFNVAYKQRLEIPYGKTGNRQKVGITSYTGGGEHLKWKAVKVGNRFQFIPMHDQARALDAWKSKSSIVHTYNKSTGNYNQIFTLYYQGVSRKSNVASLDSSKATKELEEISTAIQLYPNPSKGDLTIDFGNLETTSASATLYDLSGRKIKTFNALSKLTKVNIADLPSGSYLFLLKTGTDIISKHITLFN